MINITNELKMIIQNYPALDIAACERQFDPIKNNYKKVFYWEDLPKIKPEDIKEDINYILRSSEKYPDVDLDFLKYFPPDKSNIILEDFPTTLSFGRKAIGHLLYEVIDPVEHSKKVISLKDKAIMELRFKGNYSLLAGLITNEEKALINSKPIYKIRFNDLWQLVHEAALLACLYNLSTGSHGVINEFTLNLVGELGAAGISQDQTEKILIKYLRLINREDRTKETRETIKSIYKSGKFSNLFSKHHVLPWEYKDKHTVREIIKTLNEPPIVEKDYFEPQIWGQFKQPTKVREFVIQDYLKKGNLSLVVGPPGVSKTTFLCSTALSYVGGFDLFGKKVYETGIALLLVAEEDYNEMDLRLQATEQVLGKVDKNKIHVIGYDHNFKMVHFTKDGSKKLKLYDHLENYIRKNNIGFIGMDPLISYQSGTFDENSNPQMDDFCKNYLIPLAQRNNASIMINHHTNKISQMNDSGSSSDLAMHAGRGASSLVAAARIVIGLSSMSKTLWEKEYKTEVLENERKLYVAIIDAKNNYSATSEVPKWIKKTVRKIECSNGIENVAALMDCNLTELKDKRSALHTEYQKQRIEKLIQEIQTCFNDSKSNEDVSVHSIAAKLASKDSRVSHEKESTLIQEYSRLLKGGLFTEIKFGKWQYIYLYNGQEKKKHFINRTSQEWYDNSPF